MRPTRNALTGSGALKVGIVIVLIVLLALVLHFAFMGPMHHADAGCATCLTLLAAVLSLIVRPMVLCRIPPQRRATHRIAADFLVPTFTSGRPPPIRTVVLTL